MASNRLLIGINSRIAVLTPARFSSAVAHAPAGEVINKSKSNELGFFEKIRLRWNGIPLSGETQAPKSFFDDCDKEFVSDYKVPTVPKDYKEYPERDLVNFPYPEKRVYPPTMRMFIIPNSWYAPFEKITGTSGPYLFFYGFALFLNSKEIFVMDEHGMKICGLIGMYYFFSRSIQYRLDQFLNKKLIEEIEKYENIIKDDLKDATMFRKNAAAETESLKAVQESFPTILKENLQLQLEAVYRQNVANVASELKRRIDYLQEVEATKLRFERDILLKSITDGVQKKIETNEGNVKDLYMNSCIQQLKGLAV